MVRSLGGDAIAAILVSAAPLLGACSEPSDDPSSREQWAETFVVASEELAGWVDTEYRFANLDPTFAEGAGPRVCIDEGHFNRHTAAGIYWPFAEMLRGDGYRVTRFGSPFSRQVLADCDILVIANPQAESNMFGPGAPASNWAYPHTSAMTSEEVSEVVQWIRDDGAMFLISDHAPLAASVADLGLLLGVHMLDGYAFASLREMNEGRVGEIVFGVVREDEWRDANRDLRELVDLDFEARYELVRAAPGTLATHAVVEGPTAEEGVDWVLTYTGQAFLTTDDWSPLMVLGPDAVAVVPWVFNLEDADYWDGPLFSVAGWLQGATRELDQGRVALLGDGNMCSAGLGDLDGELEGPLVPYGINDPHAPHNARFCLNIVRWLSGLLDEPR